MSREIKTLCSYCGVGCGLIATTDGQKVLRVRGDSHHPANLGRVCPKGGTLNQTVNVSTRMRYAMVREAAGAKPAIVPAGAAVARVGDELGRIIKQHGSSAVAFYLSGQLTTEAQYTASKFAKGFLRTNHQDSNSRLCMASAASAMNLSFGSDGPPVCYDDIELADAFLFLGSNAADCHPITFERIKKRIDRGAKCVVVDPRRTATAAVATVHLAVRPKTDLALMNGLLRLLRDWDALDPGFIEQHTEGWDELNDLLDNYPPARVAKLCGIFEQDLIAAARLLADHPKQITFWTMGVNQTLQGTFTGNAIINFHLATGRIGKPGCGPFSLTGQPNAMGGRDVGYSSHGLPGQRMIANPEHRRQIERAWGVAADSIRPEPGYDAVRMFDAMARGEIKALWIIGSNPAATMPNLPVVRRALETAELVIVQDAYYPTETSRYAHVLLPAAVHFEQDGTFCNSERRVTLMQQVCPPPGDAKPDWWWVSKVAAAMGFAPFARYEKPDQIFDEFARITAGRPNDQSALHYKLLKDRGPQQWPFPAMGQSQARRYTDHQFPTASGRARFWARTHMPTGEHPDEQFPLLLTTGRLLNQWHTRTKTGTVDQLNQRDPAPYVQLHPADAEELGVTDGQEVEVLSRRGRAVTVARLDEKISPGVAFMPMHWNELFAAAASCNEVTSDETDPISKQPSLKTCAVNVRPVARKSAAPSSVDTSLQAQSVPSIAAPSGILPLRYKEPVTSPSAGSDASSGVAWREGERAPVAS